MTPPAAVVLAAGQGKRMRSARPKVVQPVAGRPMVQHVVRAARAAGADPVVVVVGPEATAVREALAGDAVRFAVQPEPLGTGHAFACAREAVPGDGRPTFALNGDGAALTAATLREVAEAQGAEPGMTLLSAEVEEPGGLGRVLRGADGDVAAVVEEKDADPEVLRVREINVGAFLFDASVWGRLEALSSDNAQGELYITDLPAAYVAAGLRVRAHRLPDAEEASAPNDRVQLARLERILRDRIRVRWMQGGVTLVAPEATFLDDTVELARDVTVEPFTVLAGATRVEEGARIGAGAHLVDCRVPRDVHVPPHTVARGSTLR